MLMHIPRAHEQGQICIYGFVGKTCLKKSSCVSKITQRNQKPENNCFHVPIYFATSCFTFEKFPPPPPLLHPIHQCCDVILRANSHVSNVIHCLEERPLAMTYSPFMGDMPKNARFASIKWTGAPVAVKPSYDSVLTCTTCQSKCAAGRIC